MEKERGGRGIGTYGEDGRVGGFGAVFGQVDVENQGVVVAETCGVER